MCCGGRHGRIAHASLFSSNTLIQASAGLRYCWGLGLPVLFYILLFTLFISCGSLTAAEQKDSASTDIAFEYELDEIVVEEQGPADDYQTGDVFLEYDTSFHSVIKQDQFEGKITDVAQVISQHSPVQVRSNGGLGSFSTISLRGSSGARLPIYVDGMLINDSSTGSVDLSNLSLSQIEQIEVYRGVVPIAFSQASIGGAINIRTRRLNKPFTKLAYGLGSFETHKIEGSYSNNFHKWDYSISASHLQSQNNHPYLFNNGTQFASNDDYVIERKHNAFTSNNIQLKTQYKISKKHKTLVSLSFLDKSKELPTWDNSDSAIASLDEKQFESNLKLLSSINDTVNSSLTAGWRYFEQVYDDSNKDLGISNLQLKYITQRRYTNLLIDNYWNNHIFSVHTEAAYDIFSPEDLLKGEKYSDSYRWSANLGIQSQSFYFSDKFIVTPAVRLYRDKSYHTKNILFEEQSKSHQYTSAQLGLQWKISQNFKLKNNLARYYRVPTFYELFADRGASKGNPDLKPEVGINIDVGFEWSKTYKETLLNETYLTTSVYQTNIKDVITWSYNSQGIGFPDNISDSSIRGIEIDAGFEADNVAFDSNLNIEDAMIINKNNTTHHNQLPGHAFLSTRNSLSFDITHQLQFTLQFTASLGKYYDSENELPVEDQYRTNSTVTWKRKHWRTDLEFRNIFNQLSEDYYLKPLPGRAFFLTVQFQR